MFFRIVRVQSAEQSGIKKVKFSFDLANYIFKELIWESGCEV